MTNDFGLDQVADNQTLKETTINTAIGQLAEAMGNPLTVDATSGNVTVSDTNYRRNAYFKRTDTTAARSVTLKAFRRFILFENSAVSTDVKLGSTTVTLSSGEKAILITDGTTNGLTKFLSSTGSAVNDIPGALTLSGVISPTQLAANTDDWAPTGLAGAIIIRASTDASRNLTGLTGGASGRVLIVENVGSFDLVFKNDVTSSASNRFYLGGADVTLTTKKTLLFVYDSTLSRWMLVGGSGSGGGATTFVALTDAFASFSAKARQFVRVNAAETALEPYEIPYTIALFVPGVMTNGQLVYQFIAVEDIRIPSGASGSQAKSGVASTGTVHFDIKKNGTDDGDITFTASSTGAFTVGSDIDLTAGDLLQIIGPATADGTLADISISIKAKRIN